MEATRSEEKSAISPRVEPSTCGLKVGATGTGTATETGIGGMPLE